MGTLAALAARGSIAQDWAAALQPAASQVDGLWRWVADERAAGNTILPAEERMFAAFQRPLADVRVLIVGQDPYPTPGHAVGLAFATAPEVSPIPRSLSNIYREAEADLGISMPAHGDLTHWADQGVMLLNRVLTVHARHAGSHRGQGWESITDLAIRALGERGGPLVAVLWGNDARRAGALLGSVPRIESVHPSPLSARRGFFGSRPLSRVNAELEAQGSEPIDWLIP